MPDKLNPEMPKKLSPEGDGQYNSKEVVVTKELISSSSISLIEEKSIELVLTNQSSTLTPSIEPKDLIKDEEVVLPNEHGCCRRYLGMSLMVLASISFSLSIVMVKKLKYDVFNVGWWRFLGGVLLPAIPFVIYLQFIGKSSPFRDIYPFCEQSKPKVLLCIFLRCVCGLGTVLFHYTSLKHVNIADATVVAYSTPVFVTFLARIMLGERFGVINIIAAFITLVGVVIIARPPFLTGKSEVDSEGMLGVGLAFVSMAFASFMFVFLRMLKQVHFAVITVFFGATGTIFCLTVSAFNKNIKVPQSPIDWLFTFGLCVFTFFGQFFATTAFKYEDAGPLSLLRALDTIFSFIWLLLFLNTIPDWFSLLGSAIVLSGVIMVGTRKYVNSLPEGHRCRRTCWIILK